MENTHRGENDYYDLSLYHCGREACKPGHYYGPAVRDHYLIHYILSGKGFYRYGEKTYYLKKGQGFLICPEKVTYYQAEETEPWTYCWVGFKGSKAGHYLQQAGLTQDNPIFSYNKDTELAECILQMSEVYEKTNWNETKLLSLLYLFLSLLIGQTGTKPVNMQKENRQEFYVNKAIEYMEMNYSRKIKVADMAGFIGLDRSYLGALFKEYTNKSLQNYLLEYRIGKACKLMEDSGLNISDISRSVGYEDPLLFSKMFKKLKGKSPKRYRDDINIVL